jgi:hypothetical protein
MTFPTVESVTETAFASNTTAHECTLPATINAGDLLLLIFANDGVTAQTTPSGWTALDKQTTGNQVYGGVYALDAVGDESGTVDVVTAAVEAGAGHIYRITGWGGDIATDIDISTVATGSDTDAPNSTSVTAGGGSADNLFLTIACWGDDDEGVNLYPTNYTNGVSIACGGAPSESGRGGSARRELAAASDDPGAWQLAGNERWVAWTLVIAPAAASTNTGTFLKQGLFT